MLADSDFAEGAFAYRLALCVRATLLVVRVVAQCGVLKCHALTSRWTSIDVSDWRNTPLDVAASRSRFAGMRCRNRVFQHTS